MSSSLAMSHSYRNQIRRAYAPVGFARTTSTIASSGTLLKRDSRTARSTPSPFESELQVPLQRIMRGMTRGQHLPLFRRCGVVPLGHSCQSRWQWKAKVVAFDQSGVADRSARLRQDPSCEEFSPSVNYIHPESRCEIIITFRRSDGPIERIATSYAANACTGEPSKLVRRSAA